MKLTSAQVIADPDNAGKLFKVVGHAGEYFYCVPRSKGPGPASSACKGLFIRVLFSDVELRAYASDSLLDNGKALLELEETAHLEFVVSLKRN